MKKTTFPTKKQVSAVTQRSCDQSVCEKVDSGALFLTDDRMNQGGVEAFPGSHSECVILQEWHLSGISIFECGHCPQITLEVGEKGNTAILLLSFGEILSSRSVASWDSQEAITYHGTLGSWKHHVLLSEPEILPIPMSW